MPPFLVWHHVVFYLSHIINSGAYRPERLLVGGPQLAADLLREGDEELSHRRP